MSVGPRKEVKNLLIQRVIAITNNSLLFDEKFASGHIYSYGFVS